MIGTPTVNDAIEFVRGITFKPDQLADLGDEDAVVCMRTKNVQRDLDETDLIAVPKALVRKEEKYLRPGDILISSANSWELVGKCSYVGKLEYPATAGAFISIVRPKRGKTHPRFLFYWLTSPRMQHVIRHLGRQTTNISNLDVIRFKQLEFPDLAYSDQERVAIILDKADGIRRKRERAQEMASAFVESVFLELFGDPASNAKNWPVMSMAKLGDVQGGLQVSKTRESYSLKKPYLRVANVFRDRLELVEIKEIGLTPAEFDRVKLAKGDVLIVEGHGNPEEIGRASVWDGSIDECVHQNHLIRFRPDWSAVLPEYVSRMLNSRGGRRQLIAAGRTTSGLNTISTRKVKEVSVPVPPMDLQEKFVAMLDRRGQLGIKMVSEAEQSADLFASIGQRAFRGEL